jgi:hypothetical protein
LRVATIDYSVNRFLIFNERSTLLEKPGVDVSIVRGFQLISKELEELGMDFLTKGEVIRDPEKTESETINVAFYIPGVPYEEILRLWGALSRKFAGTLDPALRGRVHLVLRRKR